MVTLEQIKTLINGVRQIIPPWIKPSWNENDKKSPNYIEGRTHYTDANGNVRALHDKYLPKHMPARYKEEVDSQIQSKGFVNYESLNANLRGMRVPYNYTASYANNSRYLELEQAPCARRYYAGGQGHFEDGLQDGEQWVVSNQDSDWSSIRSEIHYDPVLTGNNPSFKWLCNLSYDKIEEGKYTYWHQKTNLQISNPEIYVSASCNSYIVIADMPFYGDNDELLGTVHNFVGGYINKSGTTDFYLVGGDSTQPAFSLTFEGWGFVSYAFNTEYGRVTVASFKVPGYDYLYREALDGSYLPIPIQMVSFDSILDESVVGEPIKVAQIIQNPGWMCVQAERAAYYLVTPHNAFLRVTYAADRAQYNTTEYPPFASVFDVVEAEGHRFVFDDKEHGFWYYKIRYVHGILDGTFTNRFWVLERRFEPILPPVTTSDEGKVLKIVDGMPAWVAET